MSWLSPGRPLRLLALDGGGVRGLSSLYILKEIMERIQTEERLPQLPLPWQYFDMICGTSTGGLIAIMLGRLRMSVDQAIESYVRLSRGIFSTKKWWWKEGRFPASELERAIKSIVKEQTGDADCPMLMESNRSDPEGCKVFVCAIDAENVGPSGTQLFRSYPVPNNDWNNCTIWEAARATSAAPYFFKPMGVRNNHGLMTRFIDGGIQFNNPIERLLEEAANIYPSRSIACIVSLGTGQKDVIRLPRAGRIPKLQVFRIFKLLQNIATNCEETHKKVLSRFQRRKVGDAYFRFNVNQGLETVGLEEWSKLDEIRSCTRNFTHGPETSGRLDAAVQSILDRKARITTKRATH